MRKSKTYSYASGFNSLGGLKYEQRVDYRFGGGGARGIDPDGMAEKCPGQYDRTPSDCAADCKITHRIRPPANVHNSTRFSAVGRCGGAGGGQERKFATAAAPRHRATYHPPPSAVRTPKYIWCRSIKYVLFSDCTGGWGENKMSPLYKHAPQQLSTPDANYKIIYNSGTRNFPSLYNNVYYILLYEYNFFLLGFC